MQRPGQQALVVDPDQPAEGDLELPLADAPGLHGGQRLTASLVHAQRTHGGVGRQAFPHAE